MSILDNVIDEHVRRTCYCQEAADSTRDVIAKEIAGIRREAKVQALREAARAFEAATINIQIFGNSPEAELVRVENAARARFVESLRARADRMETEKLLLD